MKAYIASLAIALMFAMGPAVAGNYDSSGDHGGGCSHQEKWKDT